MSKHAHRAAEFSGITHHPHTQCNTMFISRKCEHLGEKTWRRILLGVIRLQQHQQRHMVNHAHGSHYIPLFYWSKERMSAVCDYYTEHVAQEPSVPLCVPSRLHSHRVSGWRSWWHTDVQYSCWDPGATRARCEMNKVAWHVGGYIQGGKTCTT